MTTTNDRRSNIERTAIARHSDDLTLDKGRGDVDYLIGIAVAALRVHPGAEAMLNLLHALDAKAWDEALERAVMLTDRLNYREKWMLEDPQVRALARSTLRYYVVPICRRCSGRKYEEIAGTHRLGNRVCPACHGTGERPLPRDDAKRMRAILAAFDADLANVESALRAVMR